MHCTNTYHIDHASSKTLINGRMRYQDFLDRGLLLTRKLLNHRFLLVKFYGRHHDLVDRYGISVSQMTTDMFHLS